VSCLYAVRAALPVLVLRRKGCGAAWNTCSWVFGSRNGSYSTSSSYLLYDLLMPSPPTQAYAMRALSLFCPRLSGTRAFGLISRHLGCNMLLCRVSSRAESPPSCCLVRWPCIGHRRLALLISWAWDTVWVPDADWGSGGACLQRLLHWPFAAAFAWGSDAAPLTLTLILTALVTAVPGRRVTAESKACHLPSSKD